MSLYNHELKSAQLELLRIAQSTPPVGHWSFSYFGTSDCCDLHHFEGAEIAKSFRLWSPDCAEESPESTVASVRAYLATLSEPQLSATK